jgi:hypothetical protein
MFYVGLDIHDKSIAICVLSETGQVARRAQVRTIEEMMRILEGLPDRFEVCYWASCGYGHYNDLLPPVSARSLSVPSEVTLTVQDRAGGHRPLPGTGDVGHAEARDRLGGEAGCGQETERGLIMTT